MKIVSLTNYWLRSLLSVPLELIRLPFKLSFIGFYAIVQCLWPTEKKKGITIIDFNPETRADFATTIDTALALIEQNDARRFERVKREICLIVYDRWLVAPLDICTYFRATKLCKINLGRIDFNKRPKYAMALVAACIVHEATHGLLFRRRLSFYFGRTKKRVEDVCQKEEIRLLLRLGYDLREFVTSNSSDNNINNPRYVERFKDFLDARD
jgi:hypothetical protein